MFQLQLLLQTYLSLMQPTELVDLVLVLSTNLNLVAAGSSLVFFGELATKSESAMFYTRYRVRRRTIRRCILRCCGVDNRVVPF
jgi:hypothetical protein